MELKDLLAELARSKHNYQQADKVAKECKEELDAARQMVADKLAELGLKSAKNDDLTVSVVQRPSFKVTDQEAVIKWLEDEPTVDPRQYIRVDARGIEVLAKEALKATGELIPGGEFVSSEYLSVKEAK